MSLENKIINIKASTLIKYIGAVLVAFGAIIVFFYNQGKDNANSDFFKETVKLYDENESLNHDINNLNDSLNSLIKINNKLDKELDLISKELPKDRKENIIAYYNELETPVEIIITNASNNEPYRLHFTVKSKKFSHSKFQYDNYLFTIKSGNKILKKNELIRFHAAGRLRFISINKEMLDEIN